MHIAHTHLSFKESKSNGQPFKFWSLTKNNKLQKPVTVVSIKQRSQSLSCVQNNSVKLLCPPQ